MQTPIDNNRMRQEAQRRRAAWLKATGTKHPHTPTLPELAQAERLAARRAAWERIMQA